MIVAPIILFLHCLCCIFSDFPMTENFLMDLRLTLSKNLYWLPWSAWNNILNYKITHSVFNNSAKFLNCPLNPNFILQIQLPKKRLTDILRGGRTTAFNNVCFYRGWISSIVVLLTNLFSNSFSNVNFFFVHSCNNHKAFSWMSPGNKDIVRN